MRSKYKKLSFPLNVFALVQLIDRGKVTDLHYGIFQDKTDTIITAQDNSTNLILKFLPKPPINILEVGIGLGTTSSLLADLGYKATGITPDAEQIAIASEDKRIADRLQCIGFENFQSPSGEYDVILFQESAQYIDSMTLFNRAHDLLKNNGQLLIVDEVSLSWQQRESRKLHLLAHLLAQADRCGFMLAQQLNLSEQAAPTLDYLLENINRHKEELALKLELGHDCLAELCCSLEQYRTKYLDGSFGYVLLSFKKVRTPKWLMQQAAEEDSPLIRKMFPVVFQHQMSQELWTWKYTQARGSGIIALRDHTLVGHYGGRDRDILYFGKPEKAVQIGDVMVLPSDRQRKGPFFLTAATFLEQNIGYCSEYLLGFGFPNKRAMRIAELLGLYAPVGQMVEVTWTSLPKRPDVLTTLRILSTSNLMEMKKDVDYLWKQMGANLKDDIIGIRNSAYLRYRYLEHPEKHYELVLVKNRFGSRLRGIFVLHRQAEQCFLMDVICPLQEIPLIIFHARRRCGLGGHKILTAWITENYADVMAGRDGNQKIMEITVPSNIWSPGPTPETIRNHWWLMAGDTDFL